MARPTKLTAVLAIGLVAAVGLAAACGGDDNGDDVGHDMATMPTTATTAGGDTSGADQPAPAEATVVDIPVADQGMAFAVTEVRAPAGTITLRSENGTPVPHNIAMRGPDPRIGEIVGEGGVSEITVDLPPGEYQYYCSVPGHEAAGMVGTLIVE